MPANTPVGGQIGLPERPSQNAETVLSQQGQTPTPGVGAPTGFSDPAGRVLAAPVTPSMPSTPSTPTTPATLQPPAAYNQAPQPPGVPPSGGYAPQQWPAQPQQPAPHPQPAMPSSAAYPPQPQYPPAGMGGYPQQSPTPSTPFTPPTVAPSTPLTPPMVPGYAAPYMPQTPQAPGGYGQTMPAYPQQPGYAPQPGYPQQPPSQPPYQPGFPPPQPPRKRNTPLIIIGSVVAVLVLIVACGFGIFALEGAFSSGTFSSHQGTNTPQASTPQATATASVTTFFQDSLTSNTNGWLVDTTHCFFANGAYHIKNYICFVPAGDPGPNYTASVTVKQVSGSNDYPFGLSLRIDTVNNVSVHYDFGVDSQGDWAFFKVQGTTVTRLHDFTTNSAIKTGLNASNTLKVVVQGPTYTCYINGTLVGTVHDSSYTTGKVGLFSDQYEVAFNNLLITQP